MAGILDSDLTLQWRTDRNDIDSAQVGVAGFYTGGFALSLHQDPLSFTSTPIGELLTTVYSKLSCHSRPHCPISSQRPARDYELSADFYTTLGQEVDNLLEKAARRAQENERKTVQPRDL
jgi:hypothetical protein